MPGTEKDGPGQPPAAPKPSRIAQLQGEKFEQLGLAKGSIANTKKTITNCLKEIGKIKEIVEKVATKRKDLNADSFYVKSNIYSVKDYQEQAQQKLKHLSKLTVKHNEILEQTRCTHPQQDIVEECNAHIERAENEIETYRDNYQECSLEIMDFMDLYDKPASSQPSTRESSPSRLPKS